MRGLKGIATDRSYANLDPKEGKILWDRGWRTSDPKEGKIRWDLVIADKMSKNMLFPSAALLLDKPKDKTLIQTTESQDIAWNAEFSSFVSSDTSKNDSSNEHLRNNKAKDDDKRCSSSEWESEDSDEKSKKRSKKKKKKKRKHKHKTKKTEKLEQETKRRKNPKKPDTIWIEETSLETDNAFRKDRRPDKSNFEFDGLYKFDIALYKQHENWNCLGLNKNQKIEVYSTRNSKKKKRKSETIRYYKNAKLVCLPNDVDKKEFVNTVESVSFIPIMTAMKDGDVFSTEVEKTSHLSSVYLEGNKKYSQDLLENPNNIRLWLDFVHYQDELTDTNDSTDEFFSKVARTPKAIIEKKIAILDKALLKNPSSIEFVLEYARLIKEIWPAEEVQKHWKNWLFQFPNSEKLWHEYLLYLQSDLLTIRVSNVLQGFRKCFRMLIGIYEGSIRSHAPSENAEFELLKLFLQLVIFLWQAGHVEKSVCLLQCMIEFNLFSPDKFNKDEYKEKKREMFEEYFESDATRFGDGNSVGWKFFALGGWSKQEPIIPNNIIPTETLTNLNFDESLESYRAKDDMTETKAWYDLERIRECMELSPFRGDLDDCEDTERIILYDDVSFALFNVPSMELRIQLVVSYLLLLGVDVKLSLISPSVLNVFERFFEIVRNDQSNNDDVDCPCHTFLACDFVRIRTNIIHSDYQYTSTIVKRIRQIISQSLQVLVGSEYFHLLSQVWLHYELKLLWWRKCIRSALVGASRSKGVHGTPIERPEPIGSSINKKDLKAVQKFIKCLMKPDDNRSSMALWTMYGCYESNMGNHENSTKIFLTSLSLCDQTGGLISILEMSPTVRCLVDLLLDTRPKSLEISLTTEIKNKILNTFLIFRGSSKLDYSEKISGVSLLHLTSLFNESYDEFKRSFNSRECLDILSICFLCCFVVFRYCCSGIQALHNTYQDFATISQCDSKKRLFETPFLYSLLLMKHHCENDYRFFPTYRAAIESCLQLFPDNLIFHRLFVSIKQNGLDSLNVRRKYEQFLKISACVKPWLAAIEYEEKRIGCITLMPNEEKQVAVQFMDSTTGIHHRIRSLYQRMLDKEQFQYSTDLWIRYIEFQLKYGSVESAKQTFFTALRCCPASKEIYMLAIKHLDSFQEVYDLMLEKEIRVKLITEEMELLWSTDKAI